MTSRLWYVAAALLLVAGAAGAAMLVWKGLAGIDSGLIRVVAPGTHELTLSEPGS